MLDAVLVLHRLTTGKTKSTVRLLDGFWLIQNVVTQFIKEAAARDG